MLIRALAVFIVVLSGAGLGWLCRRIPVRPIAQDLGAAVLGWIIGSIGTVFVTALIAVWSQSARGSGGLGAVSGGLSDEDLVIGVVAVVVLASVARFALARPGAPPVFRRQSAVFIGAGSALLSALWTTRDIVVSSTG